MEIRNLPYVDAAERWAPARCAVILRHILPNVLSGVIVLTTTWLGIAALWITALGFIGLGVQPPTPELGADPERRAELHHARMVDNGVSGRVPLVIRRWRQSCRRRSSRRTRSDACPNIDQRAAAICRMEEHMSRRCTGDKVRAAFLGLIAAGGLSIAGRNRRCPRLRNKKAKLTIGWAEPIDTLESGNDRRAECRLCCSPICSTRWSGLRRNSRSRRTWRPNGLFPTTARRTLLPCAKE